MPAADHDRLTLAALLAMVLAVAWAAADATWTLLAPELALPDAAPAGPVAAAGPRDDGAAIGAAGILGRPEPTRAPRRVPVTRLDLELTGVYDTAGAGGYAFIREQGRDQVLYRSGAALAGGGSLREVWPDHVVLEVGGRLESLHLEADEAREAAAAGPVADRLTALRSRALADPASLAGMVEAEPYRRGGRIQGYRIRQRRQTPLFDEIGLQDGDVVREVNGIRLDGPAKGLDVLQKLASASEITAVVERAGRSFTIRQQLN